MFARNVCLVPGTAVGRPSPLSLNLFLDLDDLECLDDLDDLDDLDGLECLDYLDYLDHLSR